MPSQIFLMYTYEILYVFPPNILFTFETESGYLAFMFFEKSCNQKNFFIPSNETYAFCDFLISPSKVGGFPFLKSSSNYPLSLLL